MNKKTPNWVFFYSAFTSQLSELKVILFLLSALQLNVIFIIDVLLLAQGSHPGEGCVHAVISIRSL
jgi:hypothetical protein